jgi:hypothetical protein
VSTYFYPFRKPIVKPIAALPVKGIPRFAIVVVVIGRIAVVLPIVGIDPPPAVLVVAFASVNRTPFDTN